MNSDDNVYFDILMTNNIQSSKAPIPAYYSATRTRPLLEDTTDYSLSIIRFSLDTPYLPVWIPQIQPNQNNANLTTYSITLAYTDSSNQTIAFQQYLQFIPQDKSASSSDYYWVYNYSYLSYLVNNAFDLCFANLNTLAIDNAMTLPTNSIPVMSYDTSNQLYSMNVSSEYGVNNGQIQIYFNNDLFELFNSFPMTYYGYDAPMGKNYLINNQIINNSLNIVQESSTLANMCPIQSIVFASSLIPILPSQIGLPVVYNNGILVNASSNNNSFNILTDFVANNFDFKGFIQYAPESQYRLISLLPNQKIKDIDVSCYWMSKGGIIYPLLLSSNSTLAMKMLFTKNYDK
jgi:hypothetical protein